MTLMILGDKISGEIGELTHEPWQPDAMEVGGFGSHAPVQGSSEAVVSELHMKNTSFVTLWRANLVYAGHLYIVLSFFVYYLYIVRS